MSPIVRAVLLAPLLAPLCPAQDEGAEPDPFVAFANELEHAVLLGDADFFRASLDFDALLETVAEGIDAPEPFFQAFSEGIRSSFNLAEEIVASVETADGTYTFLRTLPGDRALFRLAGDNGLNYHELYLRRGDDGEVAIVDLYVHVTGELVSQTMRRPYLAAAASMNRGLLERLVKRESDYAKALPRIQEMIQTAQEDPAAALEICASLPESVRNQPEILLMRTQVAALVGDEAYLAALVQQDHAATFDLMLALENEYGVEWMDLEGIDTYAAFVASPEYERWTARAESIDEEDG